MSVLSIQEQVEKLQVEPFEEAACLKLDLLNVIQLSPHKYRRPLALLLAWQTDNEWELAAALKIPRDQVVEARQYLRQALAPPAIA